MNACLALSNPPGGYVKFPSHSWGGCLWDFAATACIVAEAGGTVTDINGDRLDLNRPDSVRMNHRGVVFATDPALADHLRSLRP
jgi:fructose-1,6-bisphosphatase/inositol monophosphatase family enzyme